MDASPTGQHRLGPHVVGRRVVVRRLLRSADGRVETGPTGGPAFTDLLGVCTSWSDRDCVIRTESGADVRVALADIVSGKPVPPRPSVRHRVSVREAEQHTATLFPGLATESLGEWQLRHEPQPQGRPRKRANSCLAIGEPGRPLAEAADAVRGFYTARARPALAQVELGSPVEEGLGDLGWTVVPGGDAHFLLAPVAQVRRRLAGVEMPPRVRLVTDGSQVSAFAGDLDGPDWAVGHAGVDGDWIGVHGLVVEPAYRRRGLARAVMAELLDWGAEQGARTAWLHVETDNEPAAALYQGLGFAVHHTCRYLAAP